MIVVAALLVMVVLFCTVELIGHRRRRQMPAKSELAGPSNRKRLPL